PRRPNRSIAPTVPLAERRGALSGEALISSRPLWHWLPSRRRERRVQPTTLSVQRQLKRPGAGSGGATPASGARGPAPQAEQEHCADRAPGGAEGGAQRGGPHIEPAPVALAPQPEAREESPAHNTLRTEAAEKPSRVQRALAVILANPGWSKGRIAKE